MKQPHGGSPRQQQRCAAVRVPGLVEERQLRIVVQVGGLHHQLQEVGHLRDVVLHQPLGADVGLVVQLGVPQPALVPAQPSAQVEQQAVVRLDAGGRVRVRRARAQQLLEVGQLALQPLPVVHRGGRVRLPVGAALQHVQLLRRLLPFVVALRGVHGGAQLPGRRAAQHAVSGHLPHLRAHEIHRLHPKGKQNLSPDGLRRKSHLKRAYIQDGHEAPKSFMLVLFPYTRAEHGTHYSRKKLHQRVPCTIRAVLEHSARTLYDSHRPNCPYKCYLCVHVTRVPNKIEMIQWLLCHEAEIIECDAVLPICESAIFKFVGADPPYTLRVCAQFHG
mmetsp:Transcript_1333/g.2760  ORF Transcript_1333/g.2760 Transcript_1333/m.2760 type:complete len:332 (-) Transcript_1333:478-1473(-)